MSWNSLSRTSRWAILLGVGTALGLVLGYTLSRDSDGGAPTTVVVTKQLIPEGTPAVEETRAALLDAAESGDYESLRPYIRDDLRYTFGEPVNGGPIAYWQDVERTTGEKPLEALAAILKMPYVLSHGYYVWPFAYTAESADDLSPHELELLAPLGPPSSLFPEGLG